VQLVGDRKNTHVEERILLLDVTAGAIKLVMPHGASAAPPTAARRMATSPQAASQRPPLLLPGISRQRTLACACCPHCTRP